MTVLPVPPLRLRGNLRLWVGVRIAVTLAIQMQAVAVAWQVYSLTKSALSLGYVGLAQFLPAVLLALVTGHVADRFERRRILMVCYGAIALAALLFAVLASLRDAPVPAFYGVLVLLGTARAFAGPAGQSFVPDLVPVEHLQQALAWSSSGFQMATIVGPALGGVLYAAIGARGVYLGCAALLVVGIGFVAAMKVQVASREHRAVDLEQLLGGIRYVFRNRIILGAISLDLFAVLLGGAVALLPIYAQDILHTGPWGLGVLRSAPAVGAFSTAMWLGRRPLQHHVGVLLFVSVAIFGVATMVFGASRALPLSVIALAVLGASDMVSVVIRMSVVQLATPPEMRGRVSAVNMVFIGASNELGEFESGVTAAWWGVVPAVLVGGAGTLAVVGLWSLLFPELRRIRRVEDVAARS